jgi:hypothetical protein
MSTIKFSDNSKKVGNVTFTSLKKPTQLRLDSAEIVYEPGVYGGDGSENRVNISFKVSDFLQQSLTEMEKEINATSSCLKEDIMKCKLTLDKVRFYDIGKSRMTKPEKLRGFVVNAMATVKGKWETRTSSGISLEVTDIQLLDRVEQEECPF